MYLNDVMFHMLDFLPPFQGEFLSYVPLAADRAVSPWTNSFHFRIEGVD